MGSSPARSETKPVWPAGSQEMRAALYPQLIGRLRGEPSKAQLTTASMAGDRVRNETAIARERLLRDMGRTPGVPGPERHESLRRLQEAQVRSQAGIEAQTRIGAEQQAMVQALQYAMQAPAQQSKYTGEHISTGAAMGRMAGTMALQGAGMAMGGAMGGGAGAAAGGGASGTTPSSSGFSLTGNKMAQMGLQSYDPSGMGLNVI